MHSTSFLHASFQLAVAVFLVTVPFISANSNLSQPPRGGLHIRDPVIQKRDGLPEGWSSLGCYTNKPDEPTLTALMYESDVMTIENCVNSCDGAHYIYAGIQDGVNCFCGNVLTASATTTLAANCSSWCAGDHSQMCGGNSFEDGHMSLYTSWTGATPPPQPIFVQNVSTYTLLGCYSDSEEVRTLSVQIADHLSIEGCINACEVSDYRLAGIEFAYECWCGHTIENDALKLNDTYCPLACSANSTEMCGGANTLVMYHNGTGI